MPKVWFVEMKLERMSGKQKPTRSVPMTFTKAREYLKRLTAMGHRAKIVEASNAK